MLLEPLPETRKLVLWFTESRNPPILPVEGTSGFRPTLSPEILQIRVLSAHPHKRELASQGVCSREKLKISSKMEQSKAGTQKYI